MDRTAPLTLFAFYFSFGIGDFFAGGSELQPYCSAALCVDASVLIFSFSAPISCVNRSKKRRLLSNQRVSYSECCLMSPFELFPMGHARQRSPANSLKMLHPRRPIRGTLSPREPLPPSTAYNRNAHLRKGVRRTYLRGTQLEWTQAFVRVFWG